ncbi:arsenate reductase ArsC [Nesterenkonia sp. E16_7]|uniref:arsenate reductase ArsC n=1 Tax=unclassified Nesterenkonia TaxID=2629769 RepID=UPI001A92DA92|nr:MULTISPECIES: arsenate reductase ArsC [unclassified Nesterenkonia]MBO0594599.1 arsenate reductase ArsC [Nesterenkonia sp. E16_10]MBO0599792.1 arsenate reductase ArsC [Nesterenkonia sp. E16_7]
MSTSPSAEAATSAHEHVLHRISEELAVTFAGVFAAETIERYVFESYASLARTAKIKTYLPILTRRFAQDRLNALAHAQGKQLSGVPEVLFVCVQNAGRSQMAAALLKDLAQGAINVRSAGSMPSEHLDENVVTAMEEIGISLEEQFPKPLTDDVVQAADVVITMGCGDTCPIYPGKRYEDWNISDPAALDLEGVRTVREALRTRVENLASGLITLP